MQNFVLSEKEDSKFDQFAGRPNTFEFSDYSTRIDHSKLTPDQINEAIKIEKQITTTNTIDEGADELADEEMEFSAVHRAQSPLKAQLMDALGQTQAPPGRSRTNSLREPDSTAVMNT